MSYKYIYYIIIFAVSTYHKFYKANCGVSHLPLQCIVISRYIFSLPSLRLQGTPSHSYGQLMAMIVSVKSMAQWSIETSVH